MCVVFWCLDSDCFIGLDAVRVNRVNNNVKSILARRRNNKLKVQKLTGSKMKSQNSAVKHYT